MPIDTSIYSNIQTPKFESPLNALASVAQLQQAQNTNKLFGLKFQEQQRATDDQNALTNAIRANMADGKINHEGVINALASSGSGHLVNQYQDNYLKTRKAEADIGKLQADTGKTKSETDKLDAEVAKQHFDAISQTMGALRTIPGGANPQQISTALLHLEHIGKIKPGQAQTVLAQMPQNPTQIDGWLGTLQQSAMSAKDQLALTTPDANTVANNKTSIATTGMNNAVQREQLNTPQYMETDSGLVALPKKVQPGQPITGQAVIGSDGLPLQKKLKEIPASVNTAIAENANAIRKIDNALQMVDAHPDSLGVKNYLGDGIRQRTDPQGVDVRAIIADIGSLKLHDRSGAAVTASESPRLMPFIPTVTDSPDTVKRKLGQFRKEYVAMQNDTRAIYSKEQGYKPAPTLSGPAGGQLPAGWSVKEH